jgi:hypothetical protein
MLHLPSESIDFARPFAGAFWSDVLPRGALYPELSQRVLLHAGPPFRGAPPIPVVNAAIHAVLYEGLADDAARARELLVRGDVELHPAQDHGITTPLAQVVSASMLLLVIRQQGHFRCAPIIEAPAPALRFGSTAPECLARLRSVSEFIESTVAPLVRHHPVDIARIVRTAVARGDECHGRIGVASEAMIALLEGLDTNGASRLRSNPAFVLSVLMAAAAVALRTHGSPIQAIGGNGVDFGVRLRGEPAWRCAPADAPRDAPLLDRDPRAPLPAIGDSAVIDFCGLGGQALCAAPLLANEWSSVLPADLLARRLALIDPDSGIIDPRRVLHEALSPLINLAILDSQGSGLIGRGIYSPPAGLFFI